MRFLPQNFRRLKRILLFGLSYLTPRRRRCWLFGSHTGFSGNAKYLFLECYKINPDIDYIWLGNTAEEVAAVRALGYKSYERRSFMGYIYAYTAAVYVFNTYASDLRIEASGGAYRVNLWHGVGIKCIEHKIKLGPCAETLATKKVSERIDRLPAFVKPNLFLSTSPMMTDHFAECFNISQERCIESAYPRCEIFRWSESELDSYVAKFEPNQYELLQLIKSSAYTYIYMPTWRDADGDFWGYSKIDLEILDTRLRSAGRTMIVKLHPNNHADFSGYKPTNILILENRVDVYPLLPFIDCLITDYSSILYDFILLKEKDVAMYVPDYDDYISNSRDLAYPFEDNVCGAKLYDFEALLQYIDSGDTQTNSNDIDTLREKFWSSAEQSSSREIHHRIASDIGLKL